MIATALLVIGASAQFSCIQSVQMPTFNQCVSNVLVNPITNLGGNADVTSACAGFQLQSQALYFKCLCNLMTNGMNCYTFCPNDPIIGTNQQLTNQYCTAAAQFAPPPGQATSNAAVTLPPLTLPPVVTTTTTTTAQATTTAKAHLSSDAESVSKWTSLGLAFFAVLF
ncbi:hypothetical protein HK103_005164 [Boothiomyces macroporosus]|uniref:Uncharacterized protein n=1 Tax=Boothiomyces macroporosus TaxID=261099 RepID=A0AAD5Y2Y2_9FUNG|nr:hypothetical protein HK103_005164 [Boothiomyces macroporosus]